MANNSNDVGREAAIRYAASLLNQDTSEEVVEAALRSQFPDFNLREVNNIITEATSAVLRGSQLQDPLTSPFVSPGRGITNGLLRGQDYRIRITVEITDPQNGRVLTFPRLFTSRPEDAADIANGIGRNIYYNLARKYGWDTSGGPQFSYTVDYAIEDAS